MSEPVRLLHFADLHIGMENYGRVDPDTGLNRRVMDFLARLDEVVACAIEREADAVLFAGDAFRNRTPDPTHQREFATRIMRLSQAGIPTVLLEGNHDVPVMEQRASSLAIFETLAVPHIHVIRRPERLRLETRHGPLQVVGFPYPLRQRLLTREQFRHMGQEELDMAVTDIVVRLIQQLGERLDPDAPAVLVAHFSVESAHWGSERSIMVGRDVAVPLTALTDAPWDYVALGHIHQHQSLNVGAHPPVVYSGSLERVDFGEENQPKGFCWVEVQRGATRWEYVKTPARRFLTLRVDVRTEADPLAAVRAAIARQSIAASVVRLVVAMTPEQEPHLRDADLAPLLEGAFYFQINREVDRAARDRLYALDLEVLTPTHLLEHYLRAKGKSDADVASYMQEAESIFADDGSEQGQ